MTRGSGSWESGADGWGSWGAKSKAIPAPASPQMDETRHGGFRTDGVQSRGRRHQAPVKSHPPYHSPGLAPVVRYGVLRAAAVGNLPPHAMFDMLIPPAGVGRGHVYPRGLLSGETGRRRWQGSGSTRLVLSGVDGPEIIASRGRGVHVEGTGW